VKLFSSKRRVIVAAAIVLLLFLFRPGASHLKLRIASSLSSGVGRAVEIGSAHLRLLPRPGFDLENLVVYDDPAFGAEPVLRASDVTAVLRLASLLRGRLEIARLELTEPSLNLVHGENGRWNVEALLERAARTPLAPTGNAKSEPRPEFPYIQATSARINFKYGPEKKPYALTNADFSLWQESENAWGVRLKAQPFRSDMNLNDTGVLRINGTWRRAAALRDTPLVFALEWSHAQLGQLTKLFTGNDQGWRGEVQLDATLLGTPAKLEIAGDSSIQDFRRYDLTSGRPLRLAAHCAGKYSSPDHAFHEVVCSAPVGSGRITLKGDLGLPGSHNYKLELTGENVPASAVVALAQRVKKNLPADLSASGTVRGDFSIHENAASGSGARAEGQGAIVDLRLASAANNAELGPETIPFVLSTEASSGRPAPKDRAARKSPSAMRAPEGLHLEFGPFPVALGRGVTATAYGWTNRSGYSLALAGESEIGRALRLARTFGIPALQAAAEGVAKVDLEVAGSWAAWGKGTASGFPGPQVTGTAKLHNVRVAVRGAAGPVEIASADLQLASDAARVDRLEAKAAGTSWTGSLDMPRGCGTPGGCQIHFNLHADRIALGELSEWASPRPKQRPWYRVLQASPQAGPAFLRSLRAAGRVIAERLQVRSLAATHVSANVNLENRKLDVSQLSADFFAGKHRGAWQADFSVQPAACGGSGSLIGISLAPLADTMKVQWIGGRASASYQIKGPCLADFWPAAEGSLQFDLRDGVLPHVSLTEDEGPLKIARLSGQARLRAAKIEMKDARLDSPSGKFHVSGTASLKRELDLKLAPAAGAPAGGYAITGPLARPRVAPLPGAEQARLKP
jgi:hypothetical protein